MIPFRLTALLACATLIASCATPGQPSPGASPKIETPQAARQSCALHVLPRDRTPTIADLEVGYMVRGQQLVDCDTRREQAVKAHDREHELEDEAAAARDKRRRPFWQVW